MTRIFSAHTPWPAELESELATLWGEGHSASQIGRMMGLTKNQVIGKAHRLKLPSRPPPCRRTYTRMSPEERLARNLLRQRNKRALLRLIDDPGPLRKEPPRMRMDPVRTCQTILSRSGWQSTKCDRPAVLGKSWCPACYIRFTMPAPAPKQKPEDAFRAAMGGKSYGPNGGLPDG